MKKRAWPAPVHCVTVSCAVREAATAALCVFMH